MYFTKRDFSDALTGMHKQMRAIEKELAQIGPGRIICRKINNRLYFSEKIVKKERGITRNKERISQLIRKEYILQHLRILEMNLAALKQCYKHYADLVPEEIVSNVSRKHPHLPPEMVLSPSPPRDAWAKKPYEKNPFYEEDLRYITTNGIIVRSKSEREIGNTLESMGIPYRYDVKITCEGAVYYADFVIKRSDSSTLIWEHFGREHDKVYMAKNTVRIRDYIAHGYRPWDNLIWTLDSDIQDSRNIRRIIKRFILCETA